MNIFTAENKKIIFLCTAGLIISACAAYRPDLQKPVNVAPPASTKAMESDLTLPPDLRAQEFPNEIAQLEAMVPINTDQSFQRKAHLRLALLYLDNKNPTPNYMNALKELELYVSLDPDGGNRTEIQNLLRVLRELGKAVDENKKLKIKVEQLIRENDAGRKTVEELKSLDLRLEEKRKQVK